MGISIIIPNFSDYNNLVKCIKFISSQNFNKKKLEIIVAEGKSKFKRLITKYNFSVKQKYLGFSDNQEARKFLAIKYCKFEIICFLDTDNFIQEKNFLKIHYKALQDKDVSFAYCKYYSYSNVKGLLNKYFAAIGGNDPIAYFFNKNDRLPYLSEFISDNNLKVLKKTQEYTIIKYRYIKKTIGANGFFIKKKNYLELKSYNPKNFLHIDTNINVLEAQKTKKFALVNSEITHQTSDGLLKNLLKRIKYFDGFYFNMYKKRTFKIIDLDAKKDLLKLSLLILSSFSLIFPLFYSIFKTLRTKKTAWLLHVVLINLFIFTYAYISLKLSIKKICNV
jgi:hypothetical protein